MSCSSSKFHPIILVSIDYSCLNQSSLWWLQSGVFCHPTFCWLHSTINRRVFPFLAFLYVSMSPRVLFYSVGYVTLQCVFILMLNSPRPSQGQPPWVSVLFWYVSVILWVLPCILTQWYVSGSSYTLSTPAPELTIFLTCLCSLLWTRYLETKVWEFVVFFATGTPLPLDPLSAHG